jgi:hypothetical protein
MESPNPELLSVTCLACNHHALVRGSEPIEASVFVCDECGARMAFGKLAPRVVIEPAVDQKGNFLLRTRYQCPKTKQELFVADLDPMYALAIAKNVLSLVVP